MLQKTKSQDKEIRNYAFTPYSLEEVHNIENFRVKLGDFSEALQIPNGKGDVNSLFSTLRYAIRYQKINNLISTVRKI